MASSIKSSISSARAVACRRVAVGFVLVLWAAATLFAFEYFQHLDEIPGAPAAPPRHSGTRSERLTALVFFHAQCPCSRATMAELHRVAALVERPVDYRIYFIAPDEDDDSWMTSSLYRQAAALPHATIAVDRDGVEAKKYGVETSGEVIVYRADGTLAFAGGITGARGHEGDNAGKSQLLAALNSSTPHEASAPVYGCSLPKPQDSSPPEQTP